jgi:hypothetical protein
MTQIGIEQSPPLAELLTVEPARAILSGVIEKFPEILQRLRNFGQEDQE